jgi:hypothetical protein
MERRSRQESSTRALELRDTRAVSSRLNHANAVAALVPCVTASLAMAGCGAGGQHVSLIELTKRAHALCPGALILGGTHGIECASNPTPGVGRRIEQLDDQIVAQCKTAPPSETKLVLRCGKIGG